MARNDALLIAALLNGSGARTLSAKDKQALADQREIDKVMKELESKLRHDMPTASQKIIERMADLTFGVTAALGEDAVSEVMISEAADALLKILVTAKVEWALELYKIIVETKIRPAYNNALKAGVDPVAVLMANFQLTREKAQAAVDGFAAEDKTSMVKD